METQLSFLPIRRHGQDRAQDLIICPGFANHCVYQKIWHLSVFSLLIHLDTLIAMSETRNQF